MSLPTPELVTSYLEKLEQGDRSAIELLLPHIYEDLRGVARRVLAGDRNNTLQPTAIVHEAYMRLAQVREPSWKSRKHFFDVAAMAMRQLLTDYVRRNRAKKRGGDQQREDLDGAHLLFETVADGDQLVALDTALHDLEKLNPRHARIVELRFFTGLTVEETADILQLSERAIRREWAMARAWLHRAIDQRLADSE